MILVAECAAGFRLHAFARSDVLPRMMLVGRASSRRQRRQLPENKFTVKWIKTVPSKKRSAVGCGENDAYILITIMNSSGGKASGPGSANPTGIAVLLTMLPYLPCVDLIRFEGFNIRNPGVSDLPCTGLRISSH